MSMMIVIITEIIKERDKKATHVAAWPPVSFFLAWPAGIEQLSFLSWERRQHRGAGGRVLHHLTPPRRRDEVDDKGGKRR